jgi:putative transposase
MEETEQPVSFACLSDQQRKEAMARFAVLQPHLEKDVPLARAARQAGVAMRTARRWLSRYRADGLAGLARPVRSDAGRRKLPADFASFIEGLALRKPRPSVAAIHRHTVKIAEGNNVAAPSYATVHAIIRNLDPALTTLAQEGQAAYQLPGGHRQHSW